MVFRDIQRYLLEDNSSFGEKWYIYDMYTNFISAKVNI